MEITTYSILSDSSAGSAASAIRIKRRAEASCRGWLTADGQTLNRSALGACGIRAKTSAKRADPEGPFGPGIVVACRPPPEATDIIYPSRIVPVDAWCEDSSKRHLQPALRLEPVRRRSTHARRPPSMISCDDRSQTDSPRIAGLRQRGVSCIWRARIRADRMSMRSMRSRHAAVLLAGWVPRPRIVIGMSNTLAGIEPLPR